MRNPLFINLFLGLSRNSFRYTHWTKSSRAKVWNVVIDKRKWDGSFDDSVDATCGAEHLPAKNFYQGCFGIKERRVTKKRLWGDNMAYYVTWKNYSELYQPNNGRRTHRCSYCLNPEKNVFLVLIAGTGNISVAGAVSKVPNDDMTARMQNDCWMHECSFMERWRKTGCVFIFKLPQ